MLKLKSVNVRVDKLDPKLKSEIFDIARIAREIEGENYTTTITSGNDGKHSINSLHYKNRAIDIRIRDMNLPYMVYKALKDYLEPKGFDVVYEETHIHIEYDPK